MADYAKAASELKARVDKIADLVAFFESVRSNLFTETEKANSALAYENAPLIEFKQGWPDGPAIELACGNATCTVSQDIHVASIAAVVQGQAGQTTVTFLILADESTPTSTPISPVVARRVSLTPDIEEKVGPAEIAAAFVEALIQGAP